MYTGMCTPQWSHLPGAAETNRGTQNLECGTTKCVTYVTKKGTFTQCTYVDIEEANSPLTLRVTYTYLSRSV
jgi:hypothetical protein